MGRGEEEGEFSDLHNHEFIRLITFRRDSSAVHTVVRFVAMGDYVYVQTPGSAGKIKRIKATGRVLLAPCEGDGAPLGRTRLGLGCTLDAAKAGQAEQALRAKYGQTHFDFLVQITTDDNGWETIEIRPWDE